MKISVSGINKQVVLFVTIDAPYRSAALPKTENEMTAETPAKKIKKPNEAGDKS